MKNNNKKKTVTMLSVAEIENRIQSRKENLKFQNAKLERLTDKFIKLNEANKVNYKKLRKVKIKRGRLKSKIQHIKNEIIILEIGNVEKESLIKQSIKKFQNIPYKKQKEIYGMLFLLPWLVGFILFFALPMFTTIWWSMNEMAPKPGGGFDFTYAGFRNYVSLFTSETLAGSTVLEVLTSSVIDILIDLPTIIIFSLFVAVLLNTKFKGHQLVKAIFFIPVVYNITVVNNTLSGTFGQLLGSSLDEGFQLSETFSSFLMQIGIGGGLIEFLMSAVDRIFMIINKSGIQIIIFIAALQAIPIHLYESARVEGATKYEMFWKVTIPLVSPMVITCLVFTIVDSFGSSDIMNFLTVNSQGTTMATNQPGLYSSISIIYFMINIMIIGFAFISLRKRVFYYD